MKKTKLKNSKILSKKSLIITALLMAATASFFIYKSFAAENCRELTLAPYSSGECVQRLKVMVNKVSGSNLDVNNPGFDGPLNEQLIRMEAYNSFSPHHYNNSSWVWMGVWDVLNQNYNLAIEREQAQQTPPPAPAPTPAPAPVACRDQGLTKGRTGDCVKLLNASINVVMKKCYNSAPNNSNGIFDDATNITIVQTLTAGNLGEEAKNLGYGGTVSPRMWDIITFVANAINNGGGCAKSPQATVTTPAPTPTTPTATPAAGFAKCPANANMDAGLMEYIDDVNRQKLNFDQSCHTWWLTYANSKNSSAPVLNQAAQPVVDPKVDCSTAELKPGVKSDCVRQLKSFLVGLKADSKIVDPKNNVFDESLDNVLSFMINVSSINTIPIGSYKHVVTKNIWDGIVKATLLQNQQNANDYAAKLRQDAIDKKAADEQTRVQNNDNFANAVLNLQEGDPDYIWSNVQRTLEAKVFYTKEKELTLQGPNASITPAYRGVCWLLIYPSIDGKTNLWTYSQYKSDKSGQCSIWNGERDDNNKVKKPWIFSSAVSEGITAPNISNVTKSKPSNRAINGSAQ